MTEQKNEMQIWEKSKFDGSDLLPVVHKPRVIEGVPQGVGKENTDESDVMVPQLSLLQPASKAVGQAKEGAKPGLFMISTTGEIFEPPLRVLLISHFKSRALFPKDDNPRYKGKELCIARDAVTGTFYGACDSCEHKEWGLNNEKPLCALANNLIAFTPSGPAVLRFSGDSFRNGKQFVSTWKNDIHGRNLWHHPAIVTTRQKQRTLPGGQETIYYVMDIEWLVKDDVPDDYHRAAYALQQELETAFEQGRMHAHEETTVTEKAAKEPDFETPPF